MRIMSFGDKIFEKRPLYITYLGLIPSLFTTWRMPRRDRDWEEGEVVQVVYKTRTPGRRVLGTAVILTKQPRSLVFGCKLEDLTRTVGINNHEARVDGFKNAHEMHQWLLGAHGARYWDENINILLMCWLERNGQ